VSPGFVHVLGCGVRRGGDRVSSNPVRGQARQRFGHLTLGCGVERGGTRDLIDTLHIDTGGPLRK
jgi:hypothetical protein